MAPQVTNRKEGGLMSCHGSSWKLHAFTKKEPGTVKAAQKLLGALTIGKGSARAEGGGGGS
jgi:hypothetical protein